MAKRKFKAESQRLLDLMIGSIYTHREIFLREIISNASDAVDKLCFKALTDRSTGLSREDFKIDITRDRDARILTVSDNGIGMTREEMETNLGTIAKSGSFDFKSALAKEEDGQSDDSAAVDIIGQFGVGFYSAFMVSDRVMVKSRAYGSDEAWCWESSGSDGYTISECVKEGHGTEIIMRIKEDSDGEDYSKFLDEYTLSSLIKKYSDYIRYPIRMDLEKRLPKEGSENETETSVENEIINSMIPIWQRGKSEVTEEELKSFYKEKFFDFEDPVKTIQIDAEGAVSYKALLFIPAKAAYDYYTKDYKKGLQLYSSGVLIMDRCEDLIPEHFRFVRGVVDSPDLSLNISREMLQHDRQLKVMANNIEKRIKNELAGLLQNEREKYEDFYREFGNQLKYGTVSDYGTNSEALKDLLMFKSSADEKLTTLKEYCGRMKDGQNDIFYGTGENEQFIKLLPQAETVIEKGYEILYFTGELDEFVKNSLNTYDGKTFKSINRDEITEESDEEKEDIKKKEEGLKELLDFIKETLGGEIERVMLSRKLKSKPVCLTASGDLSFEMERYLKTVQPGLGASSERILELNADHEVIKGLEALRTGDPERAKTYVKILLNQSKLMAGLPIDNPAEYSEHVFSLLK